MKFELYRKVLTLSLMDLNNFIHLYEMINYIIGIFYNLEPRICVLWGILILSEFWVKIYKLFNKNYAQNLINLIMRYEFFENETD